jgi:hypothetical protein
MSSSPSLWHKQDKEQEARAHIPQWVNLANISYKNTKILFFYCGPSSSGTMILTNWLCIISPVNQICIFVGQEEFLKRVFQLIQMWICFILLWTITTPVDHYLNRLESKYIRKLSHKYELFWLSGSWEENFKMIPLILHLYDYLPLEKNLTLLLNFFFQFFSPNDDLHQIWLELACWFWRRFFFQFKHT